MTQAEYSALLVVLVKLWESDRFAVYQRIVELEDPEDQALVIGGMRTNLRPDQGQGFYREIHKFLRGRT